MRAQNCLLVGLTAGVCVLFASCFLPETFTAKLRITKDYDLTFEFEGIVVGALALEQFAESKSLSAEDELVFKESTAELFPKKAGFESASYKGNGRWKVKYKREGVLGRKISFFDPATPLIVLTKTPNGGIEIGGLSIKEEDIAQLKKAKCQVNGTLEVVTDCKVVRQNATETPTTSGKFTTYTWKLTSEKPLSPDMLLEALNAAPLAKPAAGAKPEGTNTGAVAQLPPATLATLKQGFNPMAVTLRSGDTNTVLQPSRPEMHNTRIASSRARVNVATFSGAKSSTRITNTMPVFTFLLPGNISAADYVQLVRPAVSGNQRNVEMVVKSQRTGKQFGKVDAVAVKIELDEGAVAFPSMTGYRVTPVEPLQSGEYILRYVGGSFIDFGVDP
jgi:hypothetical protein